MLVQRRRNPTQPGSCYTLYEALKDVTVGYARRRRRPIERIAPQRRDRCFGMNRLANIINNRRNHDQETE